MSFCPPATYSCAAYSMVMPTANSPFATPSYTCEAVLTTVALRAIPLSGSLPSDSLMPQSVAYDEPVLPARIGEVRPGPGYGIALQGALVHHDDHHVRVGADPEIVGTLEDRLHARGLGRAIRGEVFLVGAERGKAAGPE